MWADATAHLSCSVVCLLLDRAYLGNPHWFLHVPYIDYYSPALAATIPCNPKCSHCLHGCGLPGLQRRRVHNSWSTEAHSYVPG